MRVFQSVPTAARLDGHSLCVGNFDGVHRGHQALIEEAARSGRVAVLTFEPHPSRVVGSGAGPRLITSLRRKQELLAELGVDAVIIQPFDRAYAQTSAEEFEGRVFDDLGVKRVVVGANFCYGASRKGTVSTLGAAAQARQASVTVVPSLELEGTPVSSTRVREAVTRGQLGLAEVLLGRPFDVDGTVVRGAGRGRLLGFPTANLTLEGELLPLPGVYAVRLQVVSGLATWPGVANLGHRPTFDGGPLSLEVHLLDAHEDLYGRRVRVFFVERLRGEKAFASPEQLRAQIALDVSQARAVLGREM